MSQSNNKMKIKKKSTRTNRLSIWKKKDKLCNKKW